MTVHVLARSLDHALVHESTCRSCPATIVWAVMEESGKRNPLDRRPDPEGRLVVVGWEVVGEHLAPVVEALKNAELERHEGARYSSHFSTCPNADAHRRR